jgi:hypothetical protein
MWRKPVHWRAMLFNVNGVSADGFIAVFRTVWRIVQCRCNALVFNLALRYENADSGGAILESDEWTASHSGRFNPIWGHCIRSTRGWLGSRACLDAVERNISALPEMELRFPGLVTELTQLLSFIFVTLGAGIAISYWLDDRGFGVRVLVGSRLFSSPRRPDRLWDPASLLFNGYRGLFPREKGARAWSWPLTHIHSLIRLHGVVLN